MRSPAPRPTRPFLAHQSSRQPEGCADRRDYETDEVRLAPVAVANGLATGDTRVSKVRTETTDDE